MTVDVDTGHLQVESVGCAVDDGTGYRFWVGERTDRGSGGTGPWVRGDLSTVLAKDGRMVDPNLSTPIDGQVKARLSPTGSKRRDPGNPWSEGYT